MSIKVIEENWLIMLCSAWGDVDSDHHGHTANDDDNAGDYDGAS